MTFYYTLLEHYQLMESLESTIKSNPHIPESIIRGYHSTALPDNNKNDRLLSHVLKLHKSGNITPDSAHLLKPHLTALAATNQLHQLKNLNTLDDHVNATKDIMDKSITKKERVDINTPIIADTPDILVRQHLNHESAVKGAMMHPKNPMYNKTNEKGKAQWCLSVDDENGKAHFNHYTNNSEHPLYTIHNKKTKRVTAFVANPYKEGFEDSFDDTLEMRDENDHYLYPHQLLANNPGLEHTVVGDFFKAHHPEEVNLAHSITNAQEVTKHFKTLDQINKVLDGNDIYLKDSLINHPLFNEHHITKLLDTNENDTSYTHAKSIQYKLINHPSFNEHHIAKSLDKIGNSMGDFYHMQRLMGHPKFNDTHRLQVINDTRNDSEFQDIKVSVLSHKGTNSNFITNILDKDIDRNNAYRTAMMISNNPNVDHSHITQALKSTSGYLRRFAIGHKHASEDDITDRLENDPDYEVRQAAIQHEKATLDHVNKAMQDPADSVRADALHSKHATIDHIKAGLKDPSPTVRGYALKSPLITKELAAPLLNDTSPFVAEKARKAMEL